MVSQKDFSKNDVWRILGIVMLIAGQYMPKSAIDIYGVAIENTNLVQVVGFFLVLLPFALKAYSLFKGIQDRKNTVAPTDNRIAPEDTQG